MLVVYNFFQISNLEWHASNFIDHESLFFLFLILGFKSFLILDEFLFHQNVVFDSFLPQ